MKYYTILRLEPKGNYYPTIPYDYKTYNDLGYGEYDIHKGIEIKNWDKNNTIYIKGKTLEDYMEFHFIIISSKIKEEMEKEGITGVQYLPIKLEQIDNNKKIIEGYYVLNILNREKEDIINDDLSKKDYFGYVWVGFKKDKLKGYDIFRIDGKEEGRFYISEKIKKIINKYIHGVSFEKINMK